MQSMYMCASVTLASSSELLLLALRSTCATYTALHQRYTVCCSFVTSPLLLLLSLLMLTTQEVPGAHWPLVSDSVHLARQRYFSHRWFKRETVNISVVEPHPVQLLLC
jgi:hypothetical protein